MEKIPEDIYRRINNEVYELEGDRWWQPDFSLNLIRIFINPMRVEYIKRSISRIYKTGPENLTVLEVGCGGGLLSEEIARLGFITTGVDPSEVSLRTASEHSRVSNLSITYVAGSGENLQFESGSFDAVVCCDVLEHVNDLPKVISEVSRVLKTGGIFIYDTFNRTFFSRIIAIKIMQEWKWSAVLPGNLHVWEMFIKPGEIKSILTENDLSCKEHCGMRPGMPYVKILYYLFKRALGKLSSEEMAKKFRMVESRSTKIMYMGYAVKA
jgi:2-polyprenyl-6-hydroxyphenyl methylase / 3-demethylubiquinone-9 3-methyltransferase